ncbi:MAG: hypothetical protein JW776_14955 [Candidatus Lokiarchaeota archaeon]|nr:hypothetical protein [Candidatus Lokiarchaeota archaeon]
MDKTKVLTVRIPVKLMERLEKIAQQLDTKKSEIAKRYLNLSEIFILTDNESKIDSDGQNLIFYPEKLINEVFNLIARIPIKDRFRTRLELGDKLGNYINSITYNMGIKENDYYSIFKLIIEKLGWFKITYKKDSEKNSIILIPKEFGEKSLVYAMIYRIVTRRQYPNEWTEELVNHEIPYPEPKGKDQNRSNNEFEDNYKKYIDDPLKVDLEQEKLDKYYFGVLKTSKV